MAWALVWAARRSCSAKLSSLGRGCRRGRHRAAGLLGLLAFVRQRGFVGDGLVRAVFQEGGHRLHQLQGMKDIAPTGDSRHGQSLSGSQAASRVGDCGLGAEASILKFHHADGPCLGIALRFQAQQIAKAGAHVGSHQYGPPALENLVIGADPHVGKVLSMVIGAGSLDRAWRTSCTLPIEMG